MFQAQINIWLPSDVNITRFCNNKIFRLNFEWAFNPEVKGNNQPNITWGKIIDESRLKAVNIRIFTKKFPDVSPDKSNCRHTNKKFKNKKKIEINLHHFQMNSCTLSFTFRERFHHQLMDPNSSVALLQSTRTKPPLTHLEYLENIN